MESTKQPTLTDFLAARMAEDEEVAKAAAHRAPQWLGPTEQGGGVTSRDEMTTIVYDEGYPTGYEAAHIARHDPARVLAECDAKRTILGMGESWCGDYEPPGSEYRADYEKRGAKHIPEAYAPWPCDGCSAAQSANSDREKVLKALASVYADHADFQEAWRA